MAQKSKNVNKEIRQTSRVFDELTFVDGVSYDEYIYAKYVNKIIANN